MGEIPRYISINEYDVSVKKDNAGEIISYPKAQLEVDRNKILCEGQGNGPVNALDNALRKTLINEYPALKEVELKDYRVRVVSGSKGTESLVRVIIESSDKKTSWSTIGVSSDIVEASWKALIDSFEYKLMILTS